MQIKDRVFIVTGASSGIGLSTAIALSERGAKVALLARSTDALQELAKRLPGSLPVTVDMTQFDRVKEAVGAVHKHYGRVDGLINNAGRSYAASVEDINPAAFDEIFHLNVLGPIVAMQAVIPLMRARGGGCIVNINSGTAFMTVPQYSVYSSSKRALLGFSLTARAELEKDHIVVSEIYPFITATNFGKNRMGNPAAGGPSSNYAEGDKPEFVAGLVLQAIEEGQAHPRRVGRETCATPRHDSPPHDFDRGCRRCHRHGPRRHRDYAPAVAVLRHFRRRICRPHPGGRRNARDFSSRRVRFCAPLAFDRPNGSRSAWITRSL